MTIPTIAAKCPNCGAIINKRKPIMHCPVCGKQFLIEGNCVVLEEIPNQEKELFVNARVPAWLRTRVIEKAAERDLNISEYIRDVLEKEVSDVS